MLIKSAAGHEADIAALEALLRVPGVAAHTRQRIEAEIRQIRAGDKAERDAAYDIEFHFGQAHSWATIHDLRVEHGGFSAQIDHVIINRLGEVWVCESKHFAEGVSVNEHGEWSRWWQGRSEGIPSPVEQNHRHVVLLERVLDDGLVRLPRRLGLVAMRPDLRSLVLVSNGARIGRPKRAVPGLDEVLKVEQLKTRLLDAFDATPAWKLSRVIGKEGLEAFARDLAALHRPAAVDWGARFGIAAGPPAIRAGIEVASDAAPVPAGAPSPQRRGSGHRCASCGEAVSFAVVKFCWNNPKRFGGSVYCMDCQPRFR